MEIIKDLGIKETKSGYKKRFVIAKCGCGKEIEVSKNSILTGNTKSCGCGYYKPTPLEKMPCYHLLKGMKRRCYNKAFYFYKDYAQLSGRAHLSLLDYRLNKVSQRKQ